MRKPLPYKKPEEITVYRCRYCGCRFDSMEQHDTHHNEQHGTHGLPFNVSMVMPALEAEENDS